MILEWEETNEYNKNALFDDCISQTVVGHVPFDWSALAAKYLQFQNHHIHVVVTGKQVNLDFGLEIPADNIFTVTLE